MNLSTSSARGISGLSPLDPAARRAIVDVAADRRDQHEPGDAIGLRRGEPQRDAAAHRVAAHDRAIDAARDRGSAAPPRRGAGCSRRARRRRPTRRGPADRSARRPRDRGTSAPSAARSPCHRRSRGCTRTDDHGARRGARMRRRRASPRAHAGGERDRALHRAQLDAAHGYLELVTPRRHREDSAAHAVARDLEHRERGCRRG